MGKNYSCNNTGKRKKSDFYETPYSLTEQFLEAESPRKELVLEPCCGNGAIVRVLQQKGYQVQADDLQNGYDFLEETEKYPAIITNPPFSLAHQFIQKAKSISEYFAFLLPLSYLHGKQRFDEIYSDHDFPLARIYVFTRYPMLGEALREDGKYHTGMMVYAWYVWEKEWKNETVVRWIDNNDFVLRKND